MFDNAFVRRSTFAMSQQRFPHKWQVRVSQYAAGGVMPVHRHAEPWFCIVLKGAYEETVLANSRAQGPGDILFCPSNIEHAQRFGPAGALKLLFTPPAACLDYLASSDLALDDAPHMSSRRSIRLGESIASELALADTYSPLAVESLLCELVAIFARIIPDDHQTNVPPWVRRVLEVIEDSNPNAITLDGLGRQVTRHPVHVAREFHRYYGRTVGAYLREKRVRKAALLLVGSKIPLTEIAFACGYAGQASFTRAFKAVYGVAPSAFRARTRLQ